MGKIIRATLCLLLASSCHAESVLVLNNTDTDLSIHFSYCDDIGSTIKCQYYFSYDLVAHHKQSFALPSENSIFQVMDSIEASKKQMGISPFMPACRATPREGIDEIILESHGGAVTCKAVKMPATPPNE